MKINDKHTIHPESEYRYRLGGCRIAPPCYTKKHSKGMTIPELFCYANRHNTTPSEPVQLRILGSGVPQQKIIALWKRLEKTAIGRWLFNFILFRVVPYSGTIHSRVLSLEPGCVVVVLKDRRAVRNHLNSIHAIALANLGELASGLAMISSVSPSIRAIVVKLEIEYLKKARGRLIAEGRASPPDDISTSVTSIAEAEIRDAESDTVAHIKVHWRLSPAETLNAKP